MSKKDEKTTLRGCEEMCRSLKAIEDHIHIRMYLHSRILKFAGKRMTAKKVVDMLRRAMEQYEEDTPFAFVMDGLNKQMRFYIEAVISETKFVRKAMEYWEKKAKKLGLIFGRPDLSEVGAEFAKWR